MSGHDTAEGLDYVTWKQMRLLTIGIFAANVLVSVSLFALGHGGVQQTVTIEQADKNAEIRADLAQRAYREIMDGMRSGSSNSGISDSSTGDGGR